MSGLKHLATTVICSISCRNGYFGLLVLHMGPLYILGHCQNIASLRIHWGFWTTLKQAAEVYDVMFFDMFFDNVFWKCIQYTIPWGKMQILKKFSSDSTKNALLFLLWTPTHHSFTFNWWFLYELKHKVLLSKLFVAFSIFNSVLF